MENPQGNVTAFSKVFGYFIFKNLTIEYLEEILKKKKTTIVAKGYVITKKTPFFKECVPMKMRNVIKNQ